MVIIKGLLIGISVIFLAIVLIVLIEILVKYILSFLKEKEK